MTIALVPIGFTLNYVLHSKSCDVELASQAMLFAVGVAVAEFVAPTFTRVCVSVPLVLFLFFIVYQRVRSPITTAAPTHKPVSVQAQKRRHRSRLRRAQRLANQKS